MLSFDDDEEFFDPVDWLSSEESIVVAKEDLVSSKSGYEIWISEPRSLKDRRENFLRGMGFDEFGSSSNGIRHGTESKVMMPLERITECSGAVSSSCAIFITSVEDNFGCEGRELRGEANNMVDESEKVQLDFNVALEKEIAGISVSSQQGGSMQIQEVKNFYSDKKKMRSWWKCLMNKTKRNQSRRVFELSKPNAEKTEANLINVRQNKKRFSEFSAVYVGQELRAHKGLILSMKFSLDGQYLASGGEDGVVRIWCVSLADNSNKSLFSKFSCRGKEGKSSSGRKKSSCGSAVIPDKVFQIEELPVQEFYGHTSDVLDLAWSKSNCLLSSSKDKTVRLWQVGYDKCLNVFRHNDYVTCIQFNPVEENHFISGSIDGKVRIWGVSERQVLDWADVRDIVTAISFQPNGKGFIVGSITGTCRFYKATGSDLQLNAKIHIDGRKKSSGNRITGIQFSKEESQRIMITSEDSKVCILDGVDIVHKYRGLPKSGSQMSASFTSNGRHIISVGEDSRVYVWNYDDHCIPSSKHPKSSFSCEHFFFEDVSVAIPWSGMGVEHKESSGCSSHQHGLITQDHQEASCGRDSERFSLARWFSMDGSCKGSATWPEDKLPIWDEPIAENDDPFYNNNEHHCHEPHQPFNNRNNGSVMSATWGLVIVTAGWDGTIRTFHNYGLPVRI